MKNLTLNLFRFLLLNIILLSTLTIYAQEPQSTVELYAGSVDQCYNATNNYAINITTKNFIRMKSFSLILKFDPTKFSFVSVVNVNPLLGGNIVTANDGVAGKVTLKWSSATDVTIGDNAIANLFDVKFGIVMFPNNTGTDLFHSALTWDAATKFYYGENYTEGYQVSPTALHDGSLNVPVSYTAANFSFTLTPEDCSGWQVNVTITSPIDAGLNYYFNGSTTPSTTGQATAIAPSNNFVRIKDANGCYSHLLSIPVAAPNPLILTNVTTETPTCSGDNGEILISASGGTGPFTYLIVPEAEYSNFKNELAIDPSLKATYFSAYKSSNFQALKPAGIYKVAVTDANRCIDLGSSSNWKTATIAEPKPISFSLTYIDAACGQTGSISVNSVNGGTGPYTFAVANARPSIPTTGWTSAPGTINGLLPNYYNVWVKDANGCVKAFANQNGTGNVLPIQSPGELSFTTNAIEAKSVCNGNPFILAVTPSGGKAPYTYSLVMGTIAGNIFGSTSTYTITSLSSTQTLTVSVKDANGCVVNQSIELKVPFPLSAYVAWINDVKCYGGNDGNFSVSAAGGVPPYKYAAKKSTLPVQVFAPDKNSTEWQTSNLFDKATVGTWIVWVMDSNGCVVGGDGGVVPVDTWRVQIRQPLPFSYTLSTINATCFGMATGKVVVSNILNMSTPFSWKINGTDYSGKEFSLSNTTSSTTNFIIDNIYASGIQGSATSNTYSITLTDKIGCSSSQQIAIWQKSPLQADVEVTNATCVGTFSGRLTISATGGLARPVYAVANNLANLDNPTTTIYMPMGTGTYTETTIAKQTLEVKKGVYYIAIKDQECSSNKIIKGPIIVDGYNAISFTGTVSKTDASANGVSDGTITVPLSGVRGGKPEFDGSGLYSFKLYSTSCPLYSKTNDLKDAKIGAGTLVSSNNTGIFTDLSGGCYYISITDTTNCPLFSTSTITILNQNQPVGTKTLNITAGTLSAVLTATEKATITDLTLIGTIDARDFKTMRDEMPLLQNIDLSKATIIEYTGTGGTDSANNITYQSHSIPAFAFFDKINWVSKKGLFSIILPSLVTNIGEYAFKGCSGLSSMNIPPSLKTIGQFAFSECTGFSSVVLPATVSSIGQYAFLSCTRLTSFYSQIQTPPLLSNVFAGVKKSECKLYIPYGTKALYQAAIEWKDFTNIIEMPGFKLNADSVNIAAVQGSSAKIELLSNIIQTPTSNGWAISSNQTWLKANPTIGYGSSTITFTADANNLTTTRVAIVTISASDVLPKTIIVTQEAQKQQAIYNIMSGNLASTFTISQLDTITSLVLSGTIDARDFKTMRDKMPKLASLDLSRVSIVSYTGTEGTYGSSNTTYPANTVPNWAFYNYLIRQNLTSVIVPANVTAIGEYAFADCDKLTIVNIPNTVTAIGNYAFYSSEALTSLTLPDALTSIGTNAFVYCQKLTEIKVQPGNLNYLSINGVLFSKDQTTLIAYPCGKKGSYDIPGTVKTIREYAFSNCYGLTGITIPNSVSSIGSYGFHNCYQLPSLYIPNSVISIENRAFGWCFGLNSITVEASNQNYISIDGVLFSKNQTQLIQFPPAKKITEYTIPASVTSIGNAAFSTCSGLTNITIPNSVKSIGGDAFTYCSKLIQISIPSSVNSIGFGAFNSCTNLNSIYSYTSVPVDLKYSYPFGSVKVATVILYVPEGTKSLYQAALYWKDFTNIIEMPGLSLSASTLTIGSVQSSKTSTNVTSNTSWTATSSQNWLTISPASGTGSQTLVFTAQANPTFLERKALITVITPDLVSKTITITQEPGVPTTLAINITAGGLYILAKSNDLSKITNLTITGTMDALDFKAIRDYMPNLAALDLSGVSIVNYTGTEGTSGTNNQYYPANTIPDNAFLNMKNLITVILPKTLTAIGKSSFEGCTGLSTITLPPSVNSIGENAFRYCSLTSIIFHSGEILVGDSAFFQCFYLNKIYTFGTTPLILNGASNPFAGLSSGIVLYVPAGSLDSYQSSDLWKNFFNYEEIKGFILASNTARIAAKEGSTSSMSISSYTNWTASSNQEWLTVDPKSGTGNQALLFTANANPSTASRIAIVTVSAIGVESQTITVTQEAKSESSPQHFNPVWTGNGTDHMNINVYSVNIDGNELEIGDEIGIFDGNICVGSGIVTQPISQTNTLDMVVSKNDGLSEGYNPGNPISFRIYQKKTGTEATNLQSSYLSLDPSWSADGIFAPGLTAFVELSVTSKVKQEIKLISGWNIISAYVILQSPNLKDVFQALIDEGKLRKVMDETGKSLENFGAFGGWKNNIGELLTTKGYKVFLNSIGTLSLEGKPVSLPISMTLTKGWNIISYPTANSQDAKAVVQSLIDAGYLRKVMDEAGKTIENFGAFGGWKNNIGNFMPGKGYKVFVTENCTFTIQAATNKAAEMLPEVLTSTHFAKSYTGNGTDHMTIHLVNLQNSGLMEGDEIGVFDGKLCVGTVTIGAEQLLAGTISIPASANDGLGESFNGFTPGHSIALKLYRNNHEHNLNIQTVQNTKNVFVNGESMFTEVNFDQTTKVNEIAGKPSIICYPNPFSDQIKIEILSANKENLAVNIYSSDGQLVRQLYNGKAINREILIWDGRNHNGTKVVQGSYFINVNGEVKKVVLMN